MNFLDEFKARGFFYQCTNEDVLNKLCENNFITAYCGFDCTAQSLHVGNLMQIMIFKLMQKYGHKPIILMGGATSKIGDPSFRNEERKLMNDEQIQINMDGIKKVFVKYLDPNNMIMCNNNDWLSDLKYIEMLRDYGRHFSVNRMLSFDSVKQRLDREQSLSFLEFNYMILQAYDFVELYKTHNCRLQIGGSDQWGNIVNGIELSRRLGNKDELFGLTTPLITTSDGRKMGKSESGSVWLNEELLSPYDYYQFWRNTNDSDVIRFLKLYTILSLEKIAELEILAKSDINNVKKILAYEATKLCHGEEKAEHAQETARMVFECGGIGRALPIIEIPEVELKDGILAYQLLHHVGICNSGGEARRLIRGNGVRLNDELLTDENKNIKLSDLNEDGCIKLSIGKKKHILLKILTIYN